MRSFLTAGLAGLAAPVVMATSTAACSLAVNDPATPFRVMPPSAQSITATFGIRKHPVLGFDRRHPGIDFDGPIGDPVIAAAVGQVAEAKWAGEFGNRIDIYHGSGYATSYSHLVRFAAPLKPGDCIEAGTVIGFIGVTGLIATPHLHFETTHHGVWLDPQLFLP